MNFSSLRKTPLLCLLLPVLLLLAACEREPEHPNVVIITFDTTRADHLGTYGMSLAHTPTIDRLAAEGVRFDDAIAAAPITAVSHASIMTGLLPPAHGVRDNGSFALGDDAVTLAERFKAAGYDTRAYVSAIVLNRRYKLDQGFDVYDDDLWGENEPKLFMIRERPAAETIDRVLGWYGQRSKQAQGKPFFLWVHLFDPHEPRRPPAWATAISPSSYDAAIAYADRELGRLVEALRASGELDHTVFVFTADHGESLGEHNEKTHAIFVYRATTRVPLIVRYPPRFPHGTPYSGPVRNVDIAPTVLDLAHLPGADQTQGTDLTPLARGDAPVADLPQYSESKLAELGFGMAPLFAVRKSGYTFIRAPRPELYDIKADPDETHNLYGDPTYQTRADALDVELEKLLQDSVKHEITTHSSPMSKATMQALQSLGYLQGAEDRASAGGIDPKDGIEVYNKLENARHYAQQRKWVRAEHELKEILAQMPRHFSARSVLALVEFKRGHLDEARAQYLALLAQDPTQFRLYGMLGQIALMQGNYEEAERNNQEALRIAPQFVEAMGQLGLIAMVRGDQATAQRWYDQALKIDPGFPTLHRRLADLHFDRGEYGAALKEYREAYTRQSRDFRSLMQAGASARRAGLPDEAEQLLRQAVALRPKSWIPLYNLACLQAQRGQADAGLQSLGESIAHGMVYAKLMTEDSDWDALRTDPRFKQLLQKVKKVDAAGSSKEGDEDGDIPDAD
ncbi:MAG: sulfatase-like hydrolase/transferase [Rudaea sp.]|nr:sulfatase-like hydrolase/transferase [Rudaea sp.]